MSTEAPTGLSFFAAGMNTVLNLLPLSSDTTVTGPGPFPFLPPFPFLLELLAGVEAKPATASARL